MDEFWKKMAESNIEFDESTNAGKSVLTIRRGMLLSKKSGGKTNFINRLIAKVKDIKKC